MKPVDEGERRRAASNCFGCGDLNPRGLKLAFRREGDAAIAELDPDPLYCGYPGLMHGGLVATLLDEAMGWAAYGEGVWTMTARMQVRFRRPVPLTRRLRVIGRVTKRRERLVQVRAELRDDDGTLLADGEGSLFRVTPKQGREIEQAYRASEAARGASS